MHAPVRCLPPKLLAAGFQPFLQGIQGGKARNGLPQPMTGVLDVLFDLPLLPARRRITELGLEEIVTGHGEEARIDITLLSTPDLVDGGFHVVVDAAPGTPPKTRKA